MSYWHNKPYLIDQSELTLINSHKDQLNRYHINIISNNSLQFAPDNNTIYVQLNVTKRRGPYYKMLRFDLEIIKERE